MLDLNGFKTFNFAEGAPYMSLTTNGVSFNKSCVLKLNRCDYAKLMINADTKQVILLPANENEEGAYRFYNKKRKGTTLSVRWNSKDLIKTLELLMNWDVSRNGYRVDGTYYPEENAILFDLSSAVALA